MFVLISRGGESIGVLPPRFQDSDSVGPMYVGARRGVRAAEARLRLDRQEAAGVVLEVVDAQDHDLVLVRRARAGRPQRGGVGAPASWRTVLLAVSRCVLAPGVGPSIVAPMS